MAANFKVKNKNKYKKESHKLDSSLGFIGYLISTIGKNLHHSKN